ncbi:MAG: hypothetical protein J6X25_05415, partial [Bacteroidales bacterium]|nr:hypothetical protein [Bacteroidales bacterium]
MKRILFYHIIFLWSLFRCVAASYAQSAEYPIAWNEGTFSIEIPNDGFSSQQIEDDVSDYITSNYYSWLSLDFVDSGSTSELWALWFTVSNNTSSTVRYADFTPWDFRIVQAAYGSSGPAIDTPSGGTATVYPGSTVGVTVVNLTSSVRAALKRRPLSGGSWTVVDSLSLTAPSCSFQRVLQDGEYQLYPLGIGFTLTYPDLLYYTYTVSGLSSDTSLDCNGEQKTGYITGYTDAGGVSHSIDSAFIGQLQQLFTWYNSGNAAGWDSALQLQASLSSGYAAITAGCPPNYGVARSWNTGLRLSSSTGITFSQPGDGDLQQRACTTGPGMAQISSSQYGVTYTISDGIHNVDQPGTGATINIYLAGSGISGAYSVYASCNGRRLLMGKRIPDNDLPPADGTVEASGPNSISATTVNGSPGNSVDVVYYDGLGRKKQEVAVRASGDGLKDIVTPVRLDHLGREWRSYLPFPQTGTAGAYRSAAFDDQALWWYSQGGCDQGSE